MNTCDSCKWWQETDYPTVPPHKYCMNEKISENNNGVDDMGYDYNEGGRMTTGPKFGCIHHEPR